MVTQKLAQLLPLLALAAAAPTSLIPRDTTPTDDVKVGDVLPAALKADIQYLFDYFAIPGAVVSVVSPDEAVNGVEVFGIKDVEGNNMTADTFHAIASNSKYVTALALATMEAWGNVTIPNGDKFTLDTKWKDIYPAFKMVDPNATEQATLANFMLMNTGIPTVNWAIGGHDDPVKTLDRFAELLPNAPFPTNASQYSTIHYGALAGVPKFVANQSLEDFLNANIWGPAGMEAKMNALDAEATGRRGQAFAIEWADSAACFLDIAEGVKYNESTACAPIGTVFDFWSDGTTLEQEGGGSVLMTGEDMYKWSALAIGKTKIIPEQALNATYSNRYDIPIVGGNSNLSYGLGVNKYKDANGKYEKFSHGGALYGHNSAFVRNPDQGVAVFAVLNEDRFGFLLSDAVANHIYKTLTNQSAPGDLQRYIDQLITQTTGIPVGESAEEAQGSEGASTGQQDTGAGASAGGDVAAPPENPRPIPDGLTIEGNYTGPGYPSLSIAPIDLTDVAAIDEAGLSVQLLQEAAAIGVNASRLAYLASWDASFTKHVLLTHFDGPAFNYTLILPRPKIGEYLNGSIAEWEATPGDTNAVKLYGFGPAFFGPGRDGQQGLGFFGNWFGQPGTVISSPIYNEVEVESTSALFCVKQ